MEAVCGSLEALLRAGGLQTPSPTHQSWGELAMLCLRADGDVSIYEDPELACSPALACRFFKIAGSVGVQLERLDAALAAVPTPWPLWPLPDDPTGPRQQLNTIFFTLHGVCHLLLTLNMRSLWRAGGEGSAGALDFTRAAALVLRSGAHYAAVLEREEGLKLHDRDESPTAEAFTLLESALLFIQISRLDGVTHISAAAEGGALLGFLEASSTLLLALPPSKVRDHCSRVFSTFCHLAIDDSSLGEHLQRSGLDAQRNLWSVLVLQCLPATAQALPAACKGQSSSSRRRSGQPSSDNREDSVLSGGAISKRRKTRVRYHQFLVAVLSLVCDGGLDAARREHYERRRVRGLLRWLHGIIEGLPLPAVMDRMSMIPASHTLTLDRATPAKLEKQQWDAAALQLLPKLIASLQWLDSMPACQGYCTAYFRSVMHVLHSVAMTLKCSNGGGVEHYAALAAAADACLRLIPLADRIDPEGTRLLGGALSLAVCVWAKACRALTGVDVSPSEAAALHQLHSTGCRLAYWHHQRYGDTSEVGLAYNMSTDLQRCFLPAAAAAAHALSAAPTGPSSNDPGLVLQGMCAAHWEALQQLATQLLPADSMRRYWQALEPSLTLMLSCSCPLPVAELYREQGIQLEGPSPGPAAEAGAAAAAGETTLEDAPALEQQQKQAALRELLLARAAATRTCAYLRCADLGGQGGPAAEHGVGSLKCGACRAVWYCGPACSRADWREGGHKRVCKQLAALRAQAEAE